MDVHLSYSLVPLQDIGLFSLEWTDAPWGMKGREGVERSESRC